MAEPDRAERQPVEVARAVRGHGRGAQAHSLRLDPHFGLINPRGPSPRRPPSAVRDSRRRPGRARAAGLVEQRRFCAITVSSTYGRSYQRWKTEAAVVGALRDFETWLAVLPRIRKRAAPFLRSTSPGNSDAEKAKAPAAN